jgi:pectate lyase
VAAAPALATAAVLAPPRSAGAAESAPIGYGAGTTGGGSATPVTVSTLAAFKTAVTGDAAKVVRVNGLISLSGQVDIGSHTTMLGVGSSSGFTGGGLRIKEETNVVRRAAGHQPRLRPRDGVLEHLQGPLQGIARRSQRQQHLRGHRPPEGDVPPQPLRLENNVFPNTKIAVTTNRSSDVDGYANLRGNDLGGAATEVSQVGSFTTPPYGYTAESASSVVASVTPGAGAGKL